MLSYGYIGLGNLGANLAMNLVKAGFKVTVNDLNRDSAKKLIAAGAIWADTPKLVAENSDAVITCLPSPRISMEVLAGKNGILEGLKKGGTWIENSTCGKEEIEAMAKVAAKHGVETLEAPVTGGVHKAAQGGITIMVGGRKELLEAHMDAFKKLGGKIFHMGDIGTASVIKVITNMLAFINLVSCGEALMLAKRGGVDLAQAFHVIKASSGNSFVHETEGQLILNGSYNINFTMDLACKDLALSSKFGRDFGVPLKLAGLTEQIFIEGRQAYGDKAWSTQIVKLLEDALSTDLRAPGFPAELE